MSDEQEARIEALTAKIHVLKVGRREVTMSMARQLDWADPADVKPFGRVRTSDNRPGRPRAVSSSGSSLVKSADSVEIIGSSSGVLVRSVSWCAILTCTSGGDGACTEIQLIKMRLDRYDNDLMLSLTRRRDPDYQQWSKEYAAHAVHDWIRYKPDRQTYEEWQKLPLILL
jgi:hypothetical protein